ncbi:acetylglutamate kinase [Botrimarina hoheduenensis]|uniref:Acetylglutamate kinase n=1 Tax=Botrimarina hoheduenensis TaxID=2528000 RepID=A0A5C5WDB9_9BACT|nr:acetylglutamate kinase [Botrimarina hoheduenensis]TWT47672.1 Acetylglutamate kinase [Botrimarina hoheduenensis]
MKEAIAKADVLIEALGWIRRFRDSVTVVKLGGSLLEDEEALRHLLIDVVFMETVGMRPVIVHGGGKAINKAMDAAGIEPRFVQGRRFTDDATLEIVHRVLAGEVNQLIAERIEDYGGRAMPLNSWGDTDNNVLFGEPIKLPNPNGDPLDLGHVGAVTRVEHNTIDNLCYAGQVPVIPSLCFTEPTDGSAPQLLNVNADTAAMAVAQAIGADKLIFLSDVAGVLRDKDDPSTLIKSLTASQSQELIASGVVGSGMIPKVEACLETLDKGVGKIHIIDGRLRHSLLLEIYTNEGVGTQIVPEPVGSPASPSAGRG